MAAAEVQIPPTEDEPHTVVDTSVSETSNSSRPASLQLQSATGSDSGSDYSQSDSRPSSLQSVPASSNFENVSLDDEPHDSTLSDGKDEERPVSMSAQDQNANTIEAPESSADWGSENLEPHSPEQSSVRPQTPPIEHASLEEPHTPTTEIQSQPPISPDSIYAVQQEMETPKATSSPVSSRPDISVATQQPESPEGSDYSASPPQSPESSQSPMQISPMTPQEAHLSIDSLQSIALSESSLDYDHLAAQQVDDVLATPRVSGVRHLRKVSSLEIMQNAWAPTRQSTFFDSAKDQPLDTPRPEDEDEGKEMDTTSAWRSESSGSIATSKRNSVSSEEGTEVNWQALDKTEEQEKEDKELAEGAEDESTAFLLARLEQENAKFSADPKSAAGPAMNKQVARVRSKSRPPSMAHLKKLVSKQDTPSIRYSFAPDVQQQLPDEPPAMTELEFWAALVQDYPSTASRLPTLTTTKIRAGIPPPLRGVVWASMSGARDKNLEEAFENLKDEKSPYEGIINKDVGRSFPGVELFRDAEGEGQKMLGRVLKCFSLHDKDIGYCQGLGFLVGPLLMNMGEQEAFCVLVRLMDHYALRPSFLPSLSGLHMRIFQFSTLLAQHHPQLSDHLNSLGVEPAYLSQWFLSCFAVTCPIAMLFRIYDVIFAEGANETVMRVALALFRRNEAKMMASNEFEEVMQLLLGRAIWDVYGCDADELVDDFTSLGNIITHQRLAELEKEFESKDGEAVGQSAGFLPDVQAAASRFLGRLWAPTHVHTPSKGAGSTLSPPSAEKEPTTGGFLSRPEFLTRPGSFLRRSPSKSNISINTDSPSEGTSSGSASVASTAPTEADVHDAAARESQADSMSMKSKSESMQTVSISASGQMQMPGHNQQQELHSQIEDLLMALSEMQREHAQMVAMLQKEREDRNDDHRAVKQLVGKLRKDGVVSAEQKTSRRSMPPPSRPKVEVLDKIKDSDKRRTLPARPRVEIKAASSPLSQIKESENKEEPTKLEVKSNEIEGLVMEVQSRLDSNARFSASFETKAQLRSTLLRTRDQLAAAETQAKDLTERAEFAETSLMTFQSESESLRSEVEELRIRVNDDFKEKQKLELTIQNLELQMRMEAKAVEKKQRTGWMSRGDSSGEVPTLNKIETQSRSRTGSISSQPGSAGGLRELKLGRRDSVGSVQSLRSMKGQRPPTDQWPQTPPALNLEPSPPTVAGAEAAPPPPPTPPPATPPPAPAAATGPSHTPSASLTVPGSAGFGRRTSSLATQAVFATVEHQPVPDEALLLELVNSKTAEAQARQEVDELKKSLQVQKRQTEDTLSQLQAEMMNARLEAEAAKAEAEQARQEARAARAEVFSASPLSTPLTPSVTLPVTPGPENDNGKSTTPSGSGSRTPTEKPEAKKTETPPASSGGGWFWSRRTASTTKVTIE